MIGIRSALAEFCFALAVLEDEHAIPGLKFDAVDYIGDSAVLVAVLIRCDNVL
jgi:hypothetical protein